MPSGTRTATTSAWPKASNSRRLNKISEAYIRGVLDGDGFIDWSNTNPRIGLEVTDKKFAMTFFNALERIGLNPHITERNRCYNHLEHPRFHKYSYTSHRFVVRATCKRELIEHIENLGLQTTEDKVAYLRGFYDSEGNYSVVRYSNRVCHNLKIVNTNLVLLTQIKSMLATFGIKASLGAFPTGAHFLQIQKHSDIHYFFKLIGGSES